MGRYIPRYKQDESRVRDSYEKIEHVLKTSGGKSDKEAAGLVRELKDHEQRQENRDREKGR